MSTLLIDKDDVGAGASPRENYCVAIIGSGPRGMSVLERLVAYLGSAAHGATSIYLIDSHEIGCGRIWRRDQPDWFLMNTVADEVSAFSGMPDGGKARPGAGPCLADWWRDRDPTYPGPNSYAPRALHGEYMQFVLQAIEAAMPEGCRLYKVVGTVRDLEISGDRVQLVFDAHPALLVDRVVVATGHTLPQLDPQHQRFADFAKEREALRYFRGDSTADTELEQLGAGVPVGIIGMGLTFYDVISALTIGRGGSFQASSSGELQYVCSGREPRIYAGSRSGLPILARGRNQKEPNYRLEPAVFTCARTNRLRARGQVDFMREVLPLLLAEVDLAWYQAQIRRSDGSARELAFRAEVIARQLTSRADIQELAATYGGTQLEPVDLDAVADPFAQERFDDPNSFKLRLLLQLDDDLHHANEGNVDSPLKSALAVIRDSRALIRSIVDYGGLTAHSYRKDFLGWYVPRSAFLSAGPPRIRTAQASALIRSGVLTVVGPRMKVVTDEGEGRFICQSPRVAGSKVPVDYLIDARVPVPCLARDTSPLLRNLYIKGILTSFVNRSGGEIYDTGGVSVTAAPFHPVSRNGEILKNLHVIGIPTEHTRWFMAVGSSRPGFWTDFFVDADAIAADISKTIRAGFDRQAMDDLD
ncbi:MAG TPA: FAD/NAD(P)-binding protein [Steroidobacteraceae bacterium]